MNKSTIAVFAAFAIMLCVVSFLLGRDMNVVGQVSDAVTRLQETNAEYSEDYIERSCAGKTGKELTDCAAEGVTRSREYRIVEEGLAVQERMTTFAGWTLLIGLFSSLAAVVGAYFVWMTLAATRETSKDANRAYLQVDAAEIILGHKAKGAHPRLTLHVRNSGNTPAVWFEIKCMYSIGQGVMHAVTKLDIGEGREYLQTLPATRWNGLSGNSELTVNAPRHIDDTFAMMETDRKNPTLVRIFGSVKYKTFFDEEYVSEFFFAGTVDGATPDMFNDIGYRQPLNKPAKLFRSPSNEIMLFEKVR